LFFSIAATMLSVAAARSSSLAAFWAANACDQTLPMKVSTKKETWARWMAPSGVLDAGRRWLGWASARSCATMADSGIAVPL
jgi:hypothetical protein